MPEAIQTPKFATFASEDFSDAGRAKGTVTLVIGAVGKFRGPTAVAAGSG